MFSSLPGKNLNQLLSNSFPSKYTYSTSQCYSLPLNINEHLSSPDTRTLQKIEISTP
jgi:hypothetical protein